MSPPGSMVAVAVCPHPPLLHPGIAGAAAEELDGLRAACDEAVRRMLAAGPDQVVVVGSAPQDRWYPAEDHHGLRRFAGHGPPADTGGAGDPVPLSLTIGRWLLRRAATPVARRGRGVPPDAPTARCLTVGGEIARSAARVGLLVMGDGSARRTGKAPGHFHAGAGTFDAAAATALATADIDALTTLDPALAAELMAAGRAPWQVLAGAAVDRDWRPELLYDDAPYGVGYLVAAWT